MSNHRAPLVSVIIPTFNRAHMIARSVDSVLAQSFSDYEIVVVDDGSTDNTGEFIKKRYGDQIRYIAQEKHEGLSAARNTGIDKARGTYIAVLDDDDKWLPEKLLLQVDLLRKRPDVALAYCGTLKVNSQGKVLAEVRPEKRGDIFTEMLYQNCLQGPASVAIFPRAALRYSGTFDVALSPCADWDLWIRMSRCGRIDFVDRPLVEYVIHENNMHGNVSGMAKDTFTILDKYLPLFEKDGGSADLTKRIYSNHLIHFAWKYFEQNDLPQFKKLLIQALELDPSNRVPIHGDAVHEREAIVLDTLREYWNNSYHGKRHVPNNVFSDHYRQLAWEYYHRDDMKNFRRCIILACRYSFPQMPVRMAVPFFKSFMGKGMADAIHRARKTLMHVGRYS